MDDQIAQQVADGDRWLGAFAVVMAGLFVLAGLLWIGTALFARSRLARLGAALVGVVGSMAKAQALVAQMVIAKKMVEAMGVKVDGVEVDTAGAHPPATTSDDEDAPKVSGRDTKLH